MESSLLEVQSRMWLAANRNASRTCLLFLRTSSDASPIAGVPTPVLCAAWGHRGMGNDVDKLEAQGDKVDLRLGEMLRLARLLLRKKRRGAAVP